MKYTQVKEILNLITKDELRELLEKYEENLILGALDDDCIEIIQEQEEDVIIAAFECDINFDDIEECYQGYERSDEDFTQRLLEDIGEIPDNLPGYIHIDWTQTAKDIMMDYAEANGHYFRCM